MTVLLSRRDFVKLAALTAAVSTIPIARIAVEKTSKSQALLSPQGEVRFVNTFCGMCAALCGVQVAVKDGKPIYITAPEGHPQRGMCGRSASGVWLWNHPLRIRKPLKRVGEKGEGKFVEVDWDTALNEIAAKLKEIAEKYGPRAIAFTFHEFWLEFVSLFRFALGSHSMVNHIGTCNNQGSIARRNCLAAGGPPTVEPDLRNASYVLLIGRAYSTANMGHVNLLRSSDKVRVVSVSPRLQEIAFGEVEWVPIKPGTDVVFLLSMINVIIEEGLYDADFLKRYTNAPFLIKPDGTPLTEADVREGGSATRYLVFDSRAGELREHTVATDPHLTYVGKVTLKDGTEIEVKTAFVLLRERARKYPPEEAERITGVPASTIRRIAREFALYRGVADDTWWTVWNGLSEVYMTQAVLTLNMLVGSYERPGGLCFPMPKGVPEIGSIVTIEGKRYWRPVWWTTIPEANPGLPEEMWGQATATRIDLIKYPSTFWNFEAVYSAILNDDPYPVRALITFGTSPIERDMDTNRVAEALKKLELYIHVDVVLTDSGLFADYILPDTTYLERDYICAGKWPLEATIHKQNKAVDPPEGVDARDWLWAFMEIIRRAWPEKARALGWKDEYADYKRYREDFLPKVFEAILRSVAGFWAPRLGRDVNELYEWIKRELDEKGYVLLQRKVYDQAGLAARGTPSRKLELYPLRNITDELDPLPDYVPPNYTPPTKPDEFVLVNGKSGLISVHGSLMPPMKWLIDESVWMNPKDAERLGIKDGDVVTLEGIDSGVRVKAKVKVTDMVVEGALYVHAQSRGRMIHKASGPQWLEEGAKKLKWASEGVNPLALVKAKTVGRVGVNNCNCSVRVIKES